MNRWLASGSLATLVMAAASAAAADIKPIVQKTCTRAVDGDNKMLERLALFTLAEAGVGVDELMSDPHYTGMPPGQAAVVAARTANIAGISEQTEGKLLTFVQEVQNELASTSDKKPGDVGLKVDSPGSGHLWLFDESKKWVVTCVGTNAPKTIVAEFEKETKREPVSVRKKVEDLGLAGDDAKKADAATFGFKRERDLQDDGTYKRKTTVSIDAAVGLKVSPDSWTAPAYLYANYTLNKDRTKPAKVEAGKKQSDDDTDVLELGAAVGDLLLSAGEKFALVGEGQAGYVVDYVGNAKRLRVRLGLIPGFFASLGICDFGGLLERDIGGQKFRTRCLLKGEMEISHVFRAGTADFHDHGEFVGLGGTAEYDVVAPLGDDRAVLGTISYRRLPMIAGHAPDVKRWDGSIKWRFYPQDHLGIDIGLTWGKGTEPKALAKEDKLQLSFGIIY